MTRTWAGYTRLWRCRRLRTVLPVRRTLREADGASAVEFALIMPVLFLLAVGAVQFGLTVNNYIVLTEAVRNGSRQFAISRGAPAPYTDSLNTVYRAAVNLTRAELNVALLVNGTPCTNDTTCSSALAAAPGQPATVTASYPCQLVVMGYDFAPGCMLTSSTTGRIE